MQEIYLQYLVAIGLVQLGVMVTMLTAILMKRGKVK